MGIVLASNFDVKTNLALDSRTNKNTIEERNAIPAEVRFEGLECYVKEDGGLYRLTGGVENSNWSLIPYTDADGNLTIDGNLILNNSSTPINIKEYIDTLTAAGIHYIGTLDGTESSPGSFTPAAEVGDMYIVSTAGYINGVEVEVGDSILCHTDTEAADSSTYTSINSNWNYVQANISTMRGATSDTPGMSGIVPIPSAGSENKYLKGDGTWSSIAQSDVTDLVNDLESKVDKQNSVGGFEAGSNAHADTGASIGLNSSATTGGAMGENAKSGSGFAGGYNAKTQTSSSVVIDAIQLGSGTNSTAKTLQVYDYQLMDSTGNIPLDRIQSALDESGISGGQETAHTHANKDVLDGISSSDISNWNNKADKQTPDGGFVGGARASATSGAAIGNRAVATEGGAIGDTASTTTGGAVGQGTTSITGGAVGNIASATNGGAVGQASSATTGGAVGQNARAGSGFAGGASAKTIDDENNRIDAIQLGTGTNSTEKTLQVYDYQLMTADGQIPEARMSSLSSAKHTHNNKTVLDNVTQDNIDVLSRMELNGTMLTIGNISGTPDGSTDITLTGELNCTDIRTMCLYVSNPSDDTYTIEYDDIVNWNNKADKQNSDGGFAAGNGASATTGGAVGNGASAVIGGAVGNNASATYGGAVGNGASATYGGAVGFNASATYGGAVGWGATATTGGAVGQNAKTSTGFAGGYNAKTQDSSGDGIDAIQLGSGTNSTAKTLQVYEYQLMDADGNIPSERLKTSDGGFAAGNSASATSGGAVGNNASAIFSGFAGGNSASATSGGAVGSVAEETGGGFAGGNSASATSGGAVGSGAKTSTGFAGGYNAKTQDSSGDGINAIQLGTGTNSTAKTLQVYNYQLMTANGQIPEARMSSLSSAKHTHSNKSTLDGISSTNITSWNNKVDTSDLPNIKKNSSSTSGDIISSHITIGSRGSGTYGSRTLFVGTVGTASGQSSANIGYNNTSSGANSLTVGQSNNGTGQSSGTFGLNSSTGNYSFCSGTDNEIGGYSVGMGSHISSPSNQGYCFGFGFSLETSGNNTAIGHHNKAMTKSSSSGTSGDAFVIGNGTDSATSNAFRVTYSGAVYGKSTYHSTGADYAEYFEWEDGNPNTEDRRGLFVTWGNNGLVKLANEGDEILGVVSVTPSVVGNAYEDDWQGMYQTDIFGQPLSHIVHHDAEYVDIEMPDVDDEGNELETTHIEHQLLHEAYDAEEYILNPEYDSEQEYIPRSDRKEWAAVGLMGQLIVIDDGSCTVNGYCTVCSNGTATTSDTGFKVLKRLDDTHIKVFIK